MTTDTTRSAEARIYALSILSSGQRVFRFYDPDTR